MEVCRYKGNNIHNIIKYYDSVECVPSVHICASKCFESMFAFANILNSFFYGTC